MMGQFLDMVLPEMGNHVNGLIHMRYAGMADKHKQ